MIPLIFLIAAVIFFVLATIGVPAPTRFNFLGAGLACFALSFLLIGRLP